MSNAKPKFEKRNALAGRSPSALDTIMPNQQPEGVTDLAAAKLIKVNLLESNPYQPRKTFPEAALAELAADIAAHGVLQPLLVRPHPDASKRGRYQIVAGERRWRAAQQVGNAEVPCIERAMGDEQMERLALVENVQRTDLAPVDEARAYRRMIDTLRVSQRDLAKSVHKDPEYIAQRLRILDDPRIEKAVETGVLGPTVGQELARVEDEATRGEILARAAQGERVTVQHVKDARRPARAPVPAPNNSAQGGEPLTPLNRVRPNLTIDQRERYQATVYRVLRVAPWRAVEVLLEFGVLEKMTVATLLRLCRETRHDRGLDGAGAPTGGVGDASTGHEHNGDSQAGGSERKAGAQ